MSVMSHFSEISSKSFTRLKYSKIQNYHTQPLYTIRLEYTMITTQNYFLSDQELQTFICIVFFLFDKGEGGILLCVTKWDRGGWGCKCVKFALHSR